MQAFDLDAVASLTDDAALVAVNAWVGASPANTARIPGLLGDAVQDNSGAFVSASAIIGAYTLSMNEVFFESSGTVIVGCNRFALIFRPAIVGSNCRPSTRHLGCPLSYLTGVLP